MRAPRSKSKRPAWFFKFIRPGFNYQLALPESFTKHLKRDKSNNKTAILTRGCLKWPVKVLEGWVLGEGFEIFVRENGVQEYDFVVFEHKGKMVFNTMVFDPSSCEREYPTDQAKKACSKAYSSYKCKRDNTPDKSRESKSEKTTSHSYFIGTLKSKSRTATLYLPKKFVVANGLTVGEMILKDVANEGLWKVKLTEYRQQLFVGWNKFRIANGLNVGDTFRFELVENGEKPLAIISRI